MSSRSILRNSALATVDTVVGTACAIVTSVLVGRLLGPTKLGHYNYVLWIANFSVALANFGVPQAVGKYAAEFLGGSRIGAAAAVLRTGFRYQLFAGLGVLIIGTCLALIAEDRSHWPYVLPIVATLPLTMLMAVATQGNNAMERFDGNVIPSLCGSLANTMGVLFVLWRGFDLPGLAIALLVSKGLDTGIRYIAFRRLFAQRASFAGTPTTAESLPHDVRGRFLRFCAQSTVLVVINLIVWNRSEMFFLRRFCDIRQVAFYSVAFGLVQAVINATTPFASAVGARLMVQHGQGQAAWQRTTMLFMRLQTLAVVPLSFGLAAVARPLLLLTYGPAYEPAVPVLVVAALLCAPAALSAPALAIIAAADRQSFTVKWGMVMVVVTLTLDWALVATGAAIGAAAANGLAQAVMVTGLWVYVSHYAGVRPPLVTLARTLAAGAAMILMVTVLLPILPLPAQLALGVPIGALVYGLMLRVLRALTIEDYAVLRRSVHKAPRALRGTLSVAFSLLVAPADRAPQSQLAGQALQ